MLDKGQTQRLMLTGFTQQGGFRLFTFEETRTGPRTRCTVRADLSLIRRFGIRVQELPLLCRELLERRANPETVFGLTFDEAEMRIHQARCEAAKEASALNRRSTRKPLPDSTTAWRTTAALRISERT